MNRRRWRCGIGILLLAALVRTGGLGAQSLWLDEAFSHLWATLPPGVAWQGMIVDAVHPPLYYLLLRPWLAVAGESEFALRFPSAVAGVLTVAVVYRVGRSWLGRRAGVYAALLLALNPFHVWYSQEARMYALLALLTLLAMMAFWWALGSRSRRAWGVFAGVSALAYLTHYFALYIPLVTFVFLVLTFERHHGVLVRWTLAQALAVLPLVTWLVALYAVGGGTFGIGWIPSPRPADLLRTLWSFALAYDGHVTYPVVAGLLAWGLLLGLGVCRGRDRGGIRVLLALAVVLPPLVTFLLSLRRPTYVDRFFIGGLPAFVLLTAAGLERLPRPIGWAAGLALAGLGLWGITRFHTASPPVFAKEDWRGAAAYVAAHESGGDALGVRYLQHVVPFQYYYRGALEPAAVTVNQQTTPLEDVAAGHGRLWLLFRAPHDDLHHLAWSSPFVLERDEVAPGVRDWIADHAPGQVATFPGLVVMRFDLGVEQ